MGWGLAGLPKKSKENLNGKRRVCVHVQQQRVMTVLSLAGYSPAPRSKKAHHWPVREVGQYITSYNRLKYNLTMGCAARPNKH